MRKIFASFMATAVSIFGLAVVCAAPAQAAPPAIQATPETIAVYASVLRQINPELPNWQSQDLARRVIVNAGRWRLDANILVAIVTVESHWHTHAISRAGAIGLGQLMPGTAALLGVNPHDPDENLSGAAHYLSALMQRFGTNHYDLVFAAYNAGPEAVSNYGGIPPFDETQNYVVRVMAAWQRLARMVHLPSDAYTAAASSPDARYWLDATQ